MSRRYPHSRGFTLVEMLVVIGIVAVLAALLLPAVMMALNHARRAAIVIELGQLNDAIEAYKKDKGDYPPNFRDVDAFVRHVRRCYPKIAPTELAYFVQTNQSTGQLQFVPRRALDEGECLVFFLGGIRDDPRYPFGRTGGASAPLKKYYEFDETRLVDDNNNGFASMRAKNSKETFYVYIDSRSYLECAQFASDPNGADYAYAENKMVPENCVRPYWSENVANNSATDLRLKFKPVNPTTFQIICAGQDGDFGWNTADAQVKFYPSAGNYRDEDKDNITNFSGGRLEDKIP